MTTRPFAAALAVVLTISFAVPAAFFVAPPKAQAISVEVVGDISFPSNIKTMIESTITAIKSTLSAALDVTNTAATVAMEINEYILQPLAFVLSGNLLRLITAGVIAFVIGKTNGTGVPQFVTDVALSLRTVSDSRALMFLNQYGRYSNSPFAGAISSSLRNNYLSKTSLAGFWAANMNTLARSSPNVNAYLNGNWSQGGVAAWFALTTQTQNNPYSLHQNSQERLASLIGPGIGGATGARIAELGWGNGFTSWCGSIGASYTPGVSGSGVNPGDPCIDKDGNPGIIRTPGSVIVAALNKVLGGEQDQVVRMGNVGPEITGILRNIGTVMQTVNFASSILGGPGSGGLLGAGQPYGSNQNSRLMQYQATPSLGVTNSTVFKNSATLHVSGPDMLLRVAEYEASWNTIRAAANGASVSVTSLMNSCTAAANSGSDNQAFIDASAAQAAAAQVALSTHIAPVLAQAAAASTTIANARAEVQRIQTNLTSGSNTANGTYATDIQILQTLSPTALDVANIYQEAQAFGTAAASPSGSLVVSGGSIIDRMSLLSTNAAALKPVCLESTYRSSNRSERD